MPNFLRDGKQVISVFCRDKQATVVISKSHIAVFDDEIAETRRMQCQRIASVQTLRARRAPTAAENWETTFPLLWCSAGRAPHNDSPETTVFSFRRGEAANAAFGQPAAIVDHE